MYYKTALFVVLLLLGAHTANAQSCASRNTQCVTKPCCAYDTDHTTPLVCASGVCRRSAEGSTTTTTTPGTTTTSTTLLPDLSALPRYVPFDSGPTWFTGSAATVRYDPRDGHATNQYERCMLHFHNWFLFYPRMLAMTARVSPSAYDKLLSRGSGQQSLIGSKIIEYWLKDLEQGDPYACIDNYLTDNWARNVKDFCDGTKGYAMPPGLVGMCDKSVGPAKHGSPAEVGMVGLVDPPPAGHKYAPLTPEMCALAADSHRLHALHTQAVLARDPELSAYYPALIRGAHLNLAALARDPWEAHLIDMWTFTGDIDWSAPNERIDRLTLRADKFHGDWHAALCPAGGGPPHVVDAGRAMLGHSRVHALRAHYDPAWVFKDVECADRPGCDQHACSQNIRVCPVDGE